MAIEVEVNLRIPTLTVRSPTEPDKRIDNSSVRFAKLTHVPSIPKPGTPLQMTAGGAHAIECAVTRADWDEAREIFVVSCSYAKKSIPSDVYHAIINDSDWRMKLLP